MADDLTLTVSGRAMSGWNEVRVSRSIERLPAEFEIAMTERFPGETSAVIIQAGDPCQVRLGDDLVLTGYVDRVMPQITPKRHEVRVAGRGKCADVVDCSAEWQRVHHRPALPRVAWL